MGVTYATVKRHMNTLRARLKSYKIGLAFAYTITLLVILAATAIKLHAIGWQGIAVKYWPHDDLLFLNLGEYIAMGEWLGPYDDKTLIKGCGYPLFIALCRIISVPLISAHHYLYFLAVFIVLLAARPLRPPPWWVLAASLVLLTCPSTFSMNTVIRENIYQSQSLLLLGLATGGLLRSDLGLSRVAGWWFSMGVIAGWMLITREECGSFLVPVGVTILGWTIRHRQRMRSRMASLLGFGLGGIALVVLPALLLNKAYYGEAVLVETTSPAFKRFYGNLQRIQDPLQMRYVPVSRAMRETAYRMSPTFTTIQTNMEGRVGKTWAFLGTYYVKSAWEVPEIAGTVFIWALQDAIRASGYGDSADEFSSFLRTVSAELESAANEHPGMVRPFNTGLTPVWRDSYWKEFPLAVLRSLNYVLSWPQPWEFSFPRTPGNTRSIFLRTTNCKEEPSSRARMPRRARALEYIGDIHRVTLPWLTATSLIAIPFLIRQNRYLLAISITLAMATVAIRVALIAYIDLTSFAALTPRYVLPLYPTLLYAVILALLVLCQPSNSRPPARKH